MVIMPIEVFSDSRGETSIVMGTMVGVCAKIRNELPGSGSCSGPRGGGGGGGGCCL